MTPEDIARIEKELGVVLPQEYRAVMTRPEAGGEDYSYTYGTLYNNADEVIKQTRFNRDLCESFGKPFPHTWVVVSQVNMSDPVLIDTTQISPRLMLLDHETNEVSENWGEQVAEFVDWALKHVPGQ